VGDDAGLASGFDRRGGHALHGIGHDAHLRISGLHIALITGILVAMLRTAQLPRFGCGAVVIPVIWFYTAATGWQSSAVRATS